MKDSYNPENIPKKMYNIEYDLGPGAGGIPKINTARSEKYSIMYNDIVGHCMHTCNN